jgi:hypothetical protein
MEDHNIPPPHYTLIETSRGDDPAIVVVNSALRSFDQREFFPWHLSVSITCKDLGQNGMPTSEESTALYQVEDEISNLLMERNNAVFLARVTCQGQRELAYRIGDPEIANQALQQLVSASSSLREWEYRMEHDEAWELARPELQLLEKDPKYS